MPGPRPVPPGSQQAETMTHDRYWPDGFVEELAAALESDSDGESEFEFEQLEEMVCPAGIPARFT